MVTPNQLCAEVLVVEDDDSTRSMLAVVLEAEGHHVTTAATGPEALSLCERKHFDCMLLDVGLGGMSGIAVAQRLGGAGSAIRPTHVLLITGLPRIDFTGTLREGLVDGYIQKPADVLHLAELVQLSLPHRACEPTEKA